MQHKALLFDAGWNGTLAAVRDLGAAGVEVLLADPGAGRQACASRFVAGRVRCPPSSQPERFLSWLLQFGRERPGYALCATSDDIAFILSAFQEELRPFFKLDAPSLEVLREVLDKDRLTAHARAVGLATPETVLPASAGDLEQAAWPRGPLLLKQKLQVFSLTHSRGKPILSGESVAAAYHEFHRQNAFAPLVLERWPGVDLPMLQEYLPEQSARIHCLSGFIDRSGKQFATRSSIKILSHPRYLGIGLCFEAVADRPELSSAVLDLCRRVGYFGVFQCELIERGDDLLLIDFNPRFYNFMALDVARGLPLGRLSYLLACGETEALAAAIDKARVEPPPDGTVWIDQTGLRMQLSMELLFGRSGLQEVARWRDFRRSARTVIDPLWAPGDRGPGRNDLLRRLGMMVRHPRDFVRRNTRKSF